MDMTKLNKVAHHYRDIIGRVYGRVANFTEVILDDNQSDDLVSSDVAVRCQAEKQQPERAQSVWYPIAVCSVSAAPGGLSNTPTRGSDGAPSRSTGPGQQNSGV